MIKSKEIASLQTRRYGKDLKLGLDRADLAIDIGAHAFHPVLDIALDLRALVIDGAQDREARERNQRQRGHERQQCQPCLNA
jgi:hypothetical protein